MPLDTERELTAELVVTFADGKYSYHFYKDGSSQLLRHGEPWRDTTGDKALLAIIQEYDELREKCLGYEEELRTDESRRSFR